MLPGVLVFAGCRWGPTGVWDGLEIEVMRNASDHQLLSFEEDESDNGDCMTNFEIDRQL